MLWATDLSLAIRCWQGAKVNSEGAVTVPASTFRDSVNQLASGPLSLILDGTKLKAEGGRAKFDLPTMKAEDWPTWPKCEGGPSLTIAPQVFARALAHTAFVAARDDSRPVLASVRCRFTGDEAVFTGCDGFRLGEYRVPMVSEPVEFLLPRTSAAQIRELLEGSHEDIEVTLAESGKAMQVALTDIQVASSLMEGTYPNYGPLLAVGENARVTLKANELLKAVKLAHIYARENQGIIRLRFGDGKMAAFATADGVGEGEASVDAHCTAPGHIAVNTAYLQELLGLFGDSEVEMTWQSASNQVLWRRKDDASYLHVLMPMFVGW